MRGLNSMYKSTALQTCLVLCLHFCRTARSGDLDFKVTATEPRSRVDAVAYLGKGVVLAATRSTHAGFIHKSEDFGQTWKSVGNITPREDITCLAADKNGVAYFLTGSKCHVWKTTDYGETWTDLGRVSKAHNGHYANAYGMLVTKAGTVLVADAHKQGGHIHRSVDGGKTWRDCGQVSTLALYRLNHVGDGIIANGWAGHIYKSTDDGVTWKDMGKLADSDLYAVEHIGRGVVLIGTKSGHIFRSTDNGETWKDIGLIGNSADDLAWLGGNRVLYSTYTGNRSMYLSEDAGRTWKKIGGVPTGRSGDWLDHFIGIHDGDTHVVVGGTNKGFLLYTDLSENKTD